MLDLFHAIFYVPIYNALILLVDIVPGHDAGVAVILLTILIKLVLFPLAVSAIKTQKAMKKIEPRLKELRETMKDDKEKQAREMMALYAENGIKPFSTMFLTLLQIPILIYLFLVFRNEAFPAINTDLLYGFIQSPETLSIMFFGLVAITQKSVILAVISGIAQFAQAYVSIPIPPSEPVKEGVQPSFGADFARSMAINARYLLPLMMAYFSYILGAALALYFITSSLFQIATELLVTKKLKEAEATI